MPRRPGRATAVREDLHDPDGLLYKIDRDRGRHDLFWRRAMPGHAHPKSPRN